MKYSVYLFFVLAFTGCQPASEPVQQAVVNRIQTMPDSPSPYKLLDWRAKSVDYDQYVFDRTLTGQYKPFVWFDSAQRNLDQTTFGLFTVIGDVRQGALGNREFHEAINGMAAILSAGLVGIDKTQQQGTNYVKMLQNYFNSENGWNIMMNNTNSAVAALGGGYARDWWYDVFPNVLFYAVSDVYPNVSQADSLQRVIADQFLKADSVLNGNYDYSFFNYATMEGVVSHIPKQQDVAAGHAYVLLCAYEKFGDLRYLKGAQSAMDAFASQTESRFYEVLMPFGALVGARLNAQHHTHYNIQQFLDWTYEGCTAADGRTGWGVLAERWGNYDVHGLQGSITDGGGYAFLMNSFDMAWPLVPMVKYDSRYAVAIGKWMLHITNAARLFYPYEIEDDHQWLPSEKEITKNVVAYEGLRKVDFTYQKQSLLESSPVALGDGPQWVKGQPEVSMFSLYGSSHVGIFGAIVKATNVEMILQLNCNATDFYAGNSFPTFLYYNPFETTQRVNFIVNQTTEFDLYDALTYETIATSVSDGHPFLIAPKSARLLVVLPAGSILENQERQVTVGGVPIAYKLKTHAYDE